MELAIIGYDIFDDQENRINSLTTCIFNLEEVCPWSLFFPLSIFFYKVYAASVLQQSKQKYAYNTHNTTHIELYLGNIFAKNSLIYVTSWYL